MPDDIRSSISISGAQVSVQQTDANLGHRRMVLLGRKCLTRHDREFCFDVGFLREFGIFFLCQLAQKVLQDGAITFPDFAEFHPKADVEGCVPDLSFNA